MAKKNKVVVKEVVSFGKAKKKKGRSSKGNKRLVRGLKMPRATASIGATLDYAQSVADPFVKSACIPDGAQGTGCFTLKNNFQCSTGTGGATGFALGLDPGQQFSNNCQLLANTFPTFQTNWSQATAYAAVNSAFAMYRVVSAGLRATYVGNTQTDGGTCVLGLVSEDVTLQSFNNQSITTATNLMLQYKIYPVRNGGQICWRPTSYEDTSDWFQVTGTAAAQTAVGIHPYLIVLFYGCNASSVIANVETVVNYEGQYQQQNFIPGGLNNNDKTPAEPGWFEKSKQMLMNVEPIIPMVGSMIDSALGTPGLISGMSGLLLPGKQSQGLLGWK